MIQRVKGYECKMNEEFPVKHTAIHHKHLVLGASVISEGGWLRPEKYSSPKEETENAQQNVGIYDSSTVEKIDIRGKELDKLLRKLYSRARANVGQVIDLKIKGEESNQGQTMWCKLSIDRALIISTRYNIERMVVSLVKDVSSYANATNVTSGYSGISLVGPMSRNLLSKLTELDLSAGGFPDHSCKVTRLAGVQSIVVRADIGGNMNFMVLVSRDCGEFIWDTISHAGKEFEATPIGTVAYRMLGEEMSKK